MAGIIGETKIQGAIAQRAILEKILEKFGIENKETEMYKIVKNEYDSICEKFSLTKNI